MADSDLLQIWRANAEHIERRIAEYGGESRAPLELVHLLRRAREEIAALEMDASEAPLRSRAEDMLIRGSPYTLVEIERLRRDLAAWQAEMMKDLLRMAEEKTPLLDASTHDELDRLKETIAELQVSTAVLTRELSAIRETLHPLPNLIKDSERMKQYLGINGWIGQREKDVRLLIGMLFIIALIILNGLFEMYIFFSK